MDIKNPVSLLYFISFVSFVACGESQTSEYTAIFIHQQKVMMNFKDALDIRCKLNGKYQNMEMGNLLRQIKLDDYLKACSEALNKFDKNLSIEPNEMAFKSMYYKMLKWLQHHTFLIRNSVTVTTTSEFNDAIANIMAKIETSDIRMAFDEKIFNIQDPLQLSSFGNETDNVVQLIYDIESREVEVIEKSKKLETKLIYGRTKYYEIVCCYNIGCRRIEVYENFFRKFHGLEDGTSQDAFFRNLKLIGMIDAALTIFTEGSLPHTENLHYVKGDDGQNYLKDFNYEKVNLKSYFQGSIAHFQFTSLLFFKVVENCVLQELVPELADDVSYQFQITLLENFSTRSFDLRFKALNYQVANTLNIVGQSYSENKDRLTNPVIKSRFYRLLKWLDKQVKSPASLYTENKIKSIFSSNKEIAPDANDAANTDIPVGIYTLKQLTDFCTDGTVPQVSYFSFNYWIDSVRSLLSKIW